METILEEIWEAAMTHPSALDEIDRVVDRTIEDRDRAARLKAALHQQYDLTRPGKRKSEVYSGFSDDAEEFWDNVPV